MVTYKGDYSATYYGTENSLSFSFSGRVELLKYVYFYAQKSIIKAGNNKFQDLINAPRMSAVRSGIPPKFELIQAFIVVLVACKNDVQEW